MEDYLSDNIAHDNGLRGQLNGDWLLGGVHQFNALAGAEVRETLAENNAVTRYGYDEDSGTFKTVNSTTPYNTLYGYTMTIGDNTGGIIKSRKRYFSYYGNASYSFDSKYVATGSFRFDDYTLLGIDRSKRAKPFWSAGLRWNAAKEDFISSVSWITDLAFRATIGTGGNVPRGGSNITVLSISGVDSRTNQPIASIQAPGNTEPGQSIWAQISIFSKASYWDLLICIPKNQIISW
jgi:TonB-dependent starch-binding outer membrane protein SusC